MSDFYEGVYEDILPVVMQLGKPVTLVRSLASLGWVQVRDSITKELVWKNKDGRIQAEKPAEASFSGYGVQSSYSHYYGNDVTIKVGDLRIYTVELPLPKQGDTMFVSEEALQVISAKPIAPGELTLMYDVQLRKG